MEFIYQIKIATDSYDAFSRPTATQGIIEAEDKKTVCEYLQKEYPEYFDGNKVAQKLSKKSEQAVYVSIYELNDYWKNYWKSEIECCVCHKKIPLIQTKCHLGSISTKNFTCSIKCEEERRKTGFSIDDAGEDYWNKRCPYYFIYKITNKVNGMVYIGYTEREPIFRWWEHFKHSQLPIGKALKEFGIECFTFEVLEKHKKEDKTVDEMHKIETDYILQYDSINNGYNCIVSKKKDYDYVKNFKEILKMEDCKNDSD